MGHSPRDFERNLSKYIDDIATNIKTGNFTEHTHRPAFKRFIESLWSNVIAINEPRRIECGAPDFILLKGTIPWGYVETKDIDAKLDEVEETEQIKRYLTSLSNFVLTNYLEFRWYVEGKLRQPIVTIATLDNKKLDTNSAQKKSLHDMLDGFYNVKVSTVRNAQDLANRMANLSRLFKDVVVQTFSGEKEKGNLHTQLTAFRETLIPEMTIEEFADMYAQTVSYGLFAARCNAPKGEFTRQNAAYSLPKTNPFLRKLFFEIAGPDLDDRVAWIVDDIAELISRTDIQEILKNLTQQQGKEDPVVHFYETFLSQYDPTTRDKRGIYYTPTPVVSFIVSSVDFLLRHEFAKPNGVADQSVLLLDPACGTGTFLFKTVDKTYSYFKNNLGLWKSYVSQKLLHRIFGFELLIPPYTIAHLKMAIQLQSLGYDLSDAERLGIYLTNSLEEGIKKSENLFANWISQEANAAAQIKTNEPIMVIIGNPPYEKESLNQGKWITDLIEDYKRIDGKPLKERKIWLQDDYVKFLRFGQWRIDKTKLGILAFITNHAYLDNPTFRGMRQSLINSFDSVYVLNLHGSSVKKESAPNGKPDENVFDIKQGVAISIFVKHAQARKNTIRYADLWGTRLNKYQYLDHHDVQNTEWNEINPTSPYYFFVPKDFALEEEYNRGWAIPQIFSKFASGITTARDSLVIDFRQADLEERISDFLDPSKDDDQIRSKYRLNDTRGWSLEQARRSLRETQDWRTKLTDILYRPFDKRKIVYDSRLIDWPRGDEMKSMTTPNVALLIHRPQSPTTEYSHVFCSDSVIDQCAVANKSTGGGNTYLFPLFLYSNDLKRKTANFQPEFIKAVELSLGLQLAKKGDLSETVAPEDLYHYVYSILYCPKFRERYAEFLKIEYPKIPITSDLNLFKQLVSLGKELVSVHLLESKALDNSDINFPENGSNLIEKGYPQFDSQDFRIWINHQQYYEHVPENLWNFSSGGYQVAQKWLKDRSGMNLTYDELMTYQRILTAISVTLKLMTKIDETIGKWPIPTSKILPTQQKIDG